MPFFDANKMGITIDYDDNMSLLGGSLRGVVNIFVRETVTLCGASLRYRIVEGCSLAGRDGASSSPDCYAIEYVLFGARSTKQSPPVRVQQGHYSYPFAIPIPHYAPPTQRFGGCGDPSLLSLFGKDVAPTGGPSGPAVRVEHLVEVVVYVALSWKDKHQSKHAPCVISCTSPQLLTALNNGMEGHIRNGYSLCYPGKSFFSKLFNSGPTKTREQADCDLFIYNTTVTLADSPFLHFAIRGKTNCPYQIQLVRVVKYTHSLPETSNNNRNRIANQTDGASVLGNNAANPTMATTGFIQRPPLIDEQVISSTTMPPLDAPTNGVKGRLLISPFAQEHSVTFTSKHISVSFYATMALQYLTNKSNSMIQPEYKMRIPINIYHGTFEEAFAHQNYDPSSPSFAANSPADGYPVTGAVMGYDAPPAGEHALFRPAAPVTDNGVTSTQWSNPVNEPTIVRPHAGGVGGASAAKRGGVLGKQSSVPAAKATEKPAGPLPPQQPTSSAAPPPADDENPLVMSRVPVSTINNRSSAFAHNAPQQQNNDGEDAEDFRPLTPPAVVERLSAHRRMYEDVAPAWVQAEREATSSPIHDIAATATGTNTPPNGDAATEAGDSDDMSGSVTTTNLI